MNVRYRSLVSSRTHQPLLRASHHRWPVCLSILFCFLLPASGRPVSGAAADGASGEIRFELQRFAVDAEIQSSWCLDLQADGLSDLLFLGKDERFYLALQNVDGSFTGGPSTIFLPEETRLLDIADLDGDAIPDICCRPEDLVLRYHCSNGRSDFWSGSVGSGAHDSAEAKPLAFTGIDLEVQGGGAIRPPGIGGGRGGSAASSGSPELDSMEWDVDLLWDLDGDSRHDLLSPRFTGLDIWLNLQDGAAPSSGAAFAAAVHQFHPARPRISLRQKRVSVNQALPVIVDLNGDGVAEILYPPRAVTGTASLVLSWLSYDPGTGKHELHEHRPSLNAGEHVTEYLLDDLNGDGLTDLVVLTTRFNPEGFGDEEGGALTTGGGGGGIFEEKGLRVYLSDSHIGRLESEPAMAIMSRLNLWQEAVIRHDDMDGDGRDDLCLFFYKGLFNANLTLDWYPGLGDGRFVTKPKTQQLEFDDADRDFIIADTDFDGDGERDLLLLVEKQLRLFTRRPVSDEQRRKKPFRKRPAMAVDPLVGWDDREGKDNIPGQTMTLTIGPSGSDLSLLSGRLAGIELRDMDGDGRRDILVTRHVSPITEEDETRGQDDDESAEEKTQRTLRVSVFYHRG